jgi:riboflavin biosynthesis pyrimidine reductase
MTVSANIILGADGSTSLGGSSAGLTDLADRTRFHNIRGSADAIMIGGNTARTEPYGKTPIPLVIISAQNEIPDLVRANPMVNIWDLLPMVALEKARAEFGPNILIEAGPKLLREFLRQGVIQELFITLSAQTGGNNKVELTELITGFVEASREDVSGTVFLKYLRN